MGLQAVSILTEGVWASLTGGWYYDKKQSHFSNLFHMYIWFIFACYPLLNFLYCNTWISWILYCLFIALIFVIVKAVNEYFHRVFDVGKCIRDETNSSSYQDPVLNSLAQDGESGVEKETLEMVTISHHSQLNQASGDITVASKSAENDEEKPTAKSDLVDDSCSAEITSKTIDLKADVHCADSGSSFPNLSLLFGIEDEDYPENEVTLISDSNVSLSKAIYTKANFCNNSMVVLEKIDKNAANMHTFRRARSEIETMNRSKTATAVPPSHPVSMEVINSKTYLKASEEKPLDKSRFKEPGNSKKWENGSSVETVKMSRIEEMAAEKQPVASCSGAYIKNDCDSSEDGDESDVSLCTTDSVKVKPPPSSNRKLSKQPMRKTRLAARKRSKSSTGRSDRSHKSLLMHEFDQRFRTKPSSIVLLNTSEDDYESGEKTPVNVDGKRPDRKFIHHSDSSSSLPSSSLSSNDDNKKDKTDEFPMNFPSTSTGLRSRERRLCEYRGKRALKYQANDCMDSESLKRQHRLHLKKTECSEDGDGKTSFEADFLRLLYNLEKGSRSNSMRDESSAKNSVVCISNSPAKLISEMLSAPGTHLATSHEDTSAGAVHLFQDEGGNWFTYTFDDNSTGLAKGLCPSNPFSKLSNSNNNESTESKFAPGKSNAMIPSNSILYLNNRLSSMAPNNNAATAERGNGSENFESARDLNKLDNLVFLNGHSSQTPDSINTQHQRDMFFGPLTMFDQNSDANRGFFLDVSMASDFISSLNNPSFSHSFPRSQQQLKPSQYYEMNILNLKTIKIRFDRLSLLAFLDRNITSCELICSILLAIMVAGFSSLLLKKEFFHDARLFLFCIVVAGSQFTLLKSVQPDAASPTHGFNRITIYSRPIYFCLVSAIILLSNEYYHRMKDIDGPIFEIYGFNLINRNLFEAICSISQTFLLAFPFLFVVGLLPQFNTFVMYVFEHIDIYIFGGTASTMGLISATYSLLRSIVAVACLYLLAHLFNIRETQRASFSVFCGILVAISYLFSRSPSDPSLLWNVITEFFSAIRSFFISLIRNSKSKTFTTSSSSHQPANEPLQTNKTQANESALFDPLPVKLKRITIFRFESDFLSCIFMAICVFSVSVSSIFKLQPFFNTYITVIAIFWSFILHYLMPQFRKQLPWLLFSSPFCKSYEYKKYEVKAPAKNMWFEMLQAWMWLIEKNVIYPLLFLGYITTDCPLFIKNYGPNIGILLLVMCGFKCLRSSFNDPTHNYIIVIFAHLFFEYDFRLYIEDQDNIFLLNYFIMSIVYYKVLDFLLKFRFVITYVAPWQITWGSAFHAFAQPFSVPHFALLLVQIFISSLLSSPLQPILGSSLFFTSYVRPVKFWERDYNTKRVDHSNTRLASQIDKAQIGSDDNNLNSIFYEHLTRSLQHSLYGDLILGRWGDVAQGDCFVLASDNLNCLVHIIELGNGFVTFQVRGLEFRGTYCQQREVEAITENVSDDDGCCCCDTVHLNGLLSVNAAFNQRWLSWEVTHTNYVLEGYSISEHTASTIVQPYDLRKALITYYVKAIIYFCITYEHFTKWIENEEIKESLSYLNDKKFVDLDPTFNYNIDEDFDIMASGVTRSSFKSCYLEWIKYCIEHGVPPANQEAVRKNEESVISLCLGLSLLGRRALGTASHHNSALMNVEFFLYGFHALFKGDFRIHCSRDEWVFQDMDFLNKVVAPSVRMSLKLHQDQFINCEEFENPKTLFESICQYQKTIVISHEADPIWRKAILSNVPSLLALRHVFDEGTDQYKVIMLNKRYLNFRVIKINRECVRGLWAGQQQELIFFRNRNPERGSIQNAKQVLRNLINSSCDQPIGYPIYVSPLTTSFSETSKSLNQIIGPSLSFSIFKRAIFRCFRRIRNRCNEVCTNSNNPNDFVFTGARITKSESSDRGLDESVLNPSAKGSLIASTHPQIVQFSRYSQLIKKRGATIRSGDEETTLNTTILDALLRSSLNAPDASSAASNVIPKPAQSQPAAASSPAAGGLLAQPPPPENSVHLNMEHSKSLIIEKGCPHHPKGDAV